ncbi:MAG TPA: nucleotidyltransferase family protein [Bacteroidales bacterium]|nr:nucleotidyltransferase family protein [Bacteroidales bacterium]
MIFSIGRLQLNQRHQLSHEQIDALLGESMAEHFPGERALMLGRLHGLMTAADALEAAGVGFIVLKGFPLSQKLYDNPCVRITGDLDLLIKPCMIGNAIGALSELGYIPAYEPWPDSKKKADKMIRFRNQFAMKHPESGLIAELHWRLFYYPVLPAARLYALVKDNLSSISISGRSFVVLNNEMELIYLVIHGGLHGYSRLKWLVDVFRYASHVNFSDNRFLELAKGFKAGRMIGLYNRLIKDWPGEAKPLPGECKNLSFLEKNALKVIFSGHDTSFQTPGSLLRYFLNVISAFPGIGYKWRMLVYSWKSLWFRRTGRQRLLEPKRLFSNFIRLR